MQIAAAFAVHLINKMSNTWQDYRLVVNGVVDGWAFQRSMKSFTYSSLTEYSALWLSLNQLPTISPSLFLRHASIMSMATPAPMMTGKSPRICLNFSTFSIGVAKPVPSPVHTIASQRPVPIFKSSASVRPDLTGWYLKRTPPNTVQSELLRKSLSADSYSSSGPGFKCPHTESIWIKLAPYFSASSNER